MGHLFGRVLALILLVLPSAADAAKRVALVVGNSAYVHAGELPNPRNDAADIASLLKETGFDTITGIDLDRAGFDGKLREFRDALKGAGVALLFYAGHGLQVRGRNYLIPIDAELATPAALATELVALDDVLRTMAASPGYKLIFLDACRNNPLGNSFASAVDQQQQASRPGLAPVGAGTDTVISYSAQPGNVAVDGEGRNSPFARALVKHLATDADLISILRAVRSEVAAETKGKQITWDHSSLRAPYQFRRDLAPPPVTEATLAWQRVARNDLIALESFVQRYPASPEADEARGRMTIIPLCIGFRVPPDRRLSCVTPVIGRERPSTARDARSFRECPDCPEMVVVPWGRFTMGSPETETGRDTGEDQVRVTIPRYFTISRSAVTLGQWTACVTAGGCKAEHSSSQTSETGNETVVEALFEGAQSFAQWLSTHTRARYRLPSEAEWEYVIRAGTTTPYWWGATIGARPGLDSHNPWSLNSSGPEWVADCWNERTSGVPRDGRPQVTGDCSRRVVRGGLAADAASARSAHRSSQPIASGHLRFRLIRELE